MGRKIPAKKHRGVKDPLQQQAKRLHLLKNKVNAPPTNPDEQPIPQSFTRLFQLKADFESGKYDKKKKKQVLKSYEEYTEKIGNPVSNMKKLPGESSRCFSMRINSAIQSINNGFVHANEMDRTLNPEEYDMESYRNKEQRMDFIEQKKFKKKLANEKRNKNNDGTEAVKLSRMKRWQLKKKDKRLKNNDNSEKVYEPQYERVMFGDIAHGPPSLHIKPRKATIIDGAPRPGKKDRLLNKLLPSETVDSKVQQSETVKNKMTVDHKAKRKDLPIGVRMRLEQSQKEAIEAYKAIKKEMQNK